MDWGPGLTSAELDAAETRWGFPFPPDLRHFLARASSRSEGFVHWAETPDAVIEDRLAWPFEGFCFDIEQAGLWRAEWGPKPDLLADRIAVFETVYKTAPKLIPIYRHRYIPAGPPDAGNPVFSVYQSDIIVYGTDLWDYLMVEFGPRDAEKNSRRKQAEAPVRKIRFWSDWAEDI